MPRHRWSYRRFCSSVMADAFAGQWMPGSAWRQSVPVSDEPVGNGDVLLGAPTVEVRVCHGNGVRV